MFIANLIILFISVISIFFMFFTQAERNYDIIYVNEICRYLYCYLNHLLHYYELVNIWILSGKSVITVYREGFIMEKCMLFDSIDEQSLQELISCLSPEIKNIRKMMSLWNIRHPNLLVWLLYIPEGQRWK